MMSLRLRPALTASVAALVGSALLCTTTPASADPIADARARAAALAATVDRLQTQAEVATERYDAVETRLGIAVTQQSLAQRQVEADQATAQTASDQADARVRALYESGGRATLLATVLSGSDPVDAMSRLHIVGSLLSYDASDASALTETVRTASRLEAQLATAARRVTALQRDAAGTAAHVQSLLDAQQRALATTTQQVRELLHQREVALAAASAQDFEAAVTAAGGHLSAGMTPTNAIAAGAIAAARTRLGDPYVWGATGPNSFDCSGLTQWSYAHVGVQLPRVAADQWNSGPHISMDSLQPGDLLFWATDVNDPATIHHVTIYLGGGLMIAAPHTGDVVKVEPVYLDGYIGATRPYGPGTGYGG